MATGKFSKSTSDSSANLGFEAKHWLSADTATMRDALSVKSISKRRFARPTREIGARFEALIRPLRHRMERNISESHTLTTLRDMLLPKLLNGELSVSHEIQHSRQTI